jgi:hypothetical protein
MRLVLLDELVRFEKGDSLRSDVAGEGTRELVERRNGAEVMDLLVVSPCA